MGGECPLWNLGASSGRTVGSRESAKTNFGSALDVQASAKGGVGPHMETSPRLLANKRGAAVAAI